MEREHSTHGRDETGYRIFVGKPEEKNHMEELRVDGRMILKRLLKGNFRM
jgi:hypothetical protein